MGDWIGDVNSGGSVNFRNVFLILMDTEHTLKCGGTYKQGKNILLISAWKNSFFFGELISIEPEKKNEDFVITKIKLKSS